MNVAEPPFSGPALDVMEDVFFAFTPEGKIIQWNRRVAEVTGYTDEEIEEMHPAEFVPADERDLIEEHIEKVLEEGHTRLEAHYQTKEGELIPYEFTGSLYEWEEETLVCGTGRDISERKQAKKDLEASEKRYRHLFEDSQEGIAITTPDGEFLEVNAAATEISGYSQEELRSMNAAEVYVYPEEREEIREQLRQEGKVSRKEVRLRRADGEEIICELSVTLRQEEDGRLFQTFFRDVTEERESKKRYRRLFEESRDAVVLTTPDGEIVDANGAAEELFGYSREELLRLDAAELYANPEERANRIVPELEEATSSRILEAEMRHSEGHTFYASASVTLHRDEEGHPELIQALVRDITERKRRQEKLATQKQNAERKNALLRLMQRVTGAANEAEHFEEALQETVDAICAQTGWPGGHVLLREEYRKEGSLRIGYLWEDVEAEKSPAQEESESGEDVLRSAGIWNRNSRDQFEACREAAGQRTFAPGEGLPGRVFETGRPEWIENVTEEETFLRAERAEETGVKGAFAFPVLLRGEVVAVLEFYSTEAEAPDEELLDAMESVGLQLSRVIERQEAIRSLSASEERYRRLFEEAQEGIAITTPEGEVLDVNPAALEIFGYSREEIRTMNTAELYVDPEERQAGLEELQEKGAIEGREFRLYRANGEEFFCRLSASIHRTEDGEPRSLLTFFRDVTERKMAEEALKESEEQFRKLAENALVGIGLLQDGKYEYANPALLEITGYSQEELLGKPLKDLIHPDEWPKTQKRIERRERGDIEQAHYEVRIQTKSGETRLVEVAGTRIDYQGEPAIIGTMQDITERRRLQKEVLHVQEEERKRLGQDLHDGIASQLTGATLKLNILAKRAEEETTEAIEEIQEIIKEGASDVRRLSRGLNPGGLSEGNLPSALRGLAQNTEGARFEDVEPEEIPDKEDIPSLNSDRATHLYRIAQEAVANARRHGDAEQIEIRFGPADSALVLEVEDDGEGFDPEEISKEGLGLRSMRHRAELLGAELRLDSAPGEGTLVCCRLPS